MLDLNERIPKIELDDSQVKQVLINVLQNSINAMSSGGAINLKTIQENEEVTVEITDTGKGIPHQYLENIYEPFFTTRGNGTGLGLSISNRIMQNHMGKLRISSKEGEGTTVWITLPLNT